MNEQFAPTDERAADIGDFVVFSTIILVSNFFLCETPPDPSLLQLPQFILLKWASFELWLFRVSGKCSIRVVFFRGGRDSINSMDCMAE